MNIKVQSERPHQAGIANKSIEVETIIDEDNGH